MNTLLFVIAVVAFGFSCSVVGSKDSPCDSCIGSKRTNLENSQENEFLGLTKEEQPNSNEGKFYSKWGDFQPKIYYDDVDPEDADYVEGEFDSDEKDEYVIAFNETDLADLLQNHRE